MMCVGGSLKLDELGYAKEKVNVYYNLRFGIIKKKKIIKANRIFFSEVLGNSGSVQITTTN